MRWFLALASACLMASGSGASGAEPAPPRRHARAARLKGNLVLDGRLDEPAWKSAPAHTGFAMPLGLAGRRPIPPEVQTSFRVLYDEARIYFGIRCNEPKMADLVARAARKHDAAMWSDDDVELFIDPVGDRMEYYQLAVNTQATTVDLYFIERGNTGKGGWSSEWQARVHRGGDFWSAEIAVPFAVFHNRPSRTWADRWVFSISRTRKPEPSYFSQYSPAEKYHDVASFGTLGAIEVDRSRFNLCAESPRFRLEPAGKGYAVSASVKVENRGDAPFVGTLEMAVLAPGATPATAALRLGPRAATRVVLKRASITQQGKWPVVFRAKARSGYLSLAIRFDEWLTYRPMTVRLTRPNYRNSIYATQAIDAVEGEVTLGMPIDQVKGCMLKVVLSSSLKPPVASEARIDAGRVPFRLPAAHLPTGRYTVRAEVLRPAPGPKKGEPAFELVAAEEITLRKLAPAPAVEARVDDQGNLLIDGQPVFLRGWYGSMQYVVSAASLPQAQVPHSTNYMMGASDREQTDLGLYTMKGVTRLIDEAKAKLDQPIDGALKAKLRAAVAEVRNKRNVIGYYISDEPECRGLSPHFLRSLYDFLADEDPYRFCKIVSRAPQTYISACDVMCPHPYLNPQRLEDGTRKFGSYLRSIHNIISAAAKANDGSKAVWSMPQTFSYGGLRGRHPTFRESRWFVHTSIACGAKGIVPFIFNGYWNHHESRVAMGCVFEELTFLAPAWMNRDTDAPAACDNADVDVIAKHWRPPRAVRGHTFIVAANQSRRPAKGTFTVPALGKNKNRRLLVIRENRVVPVEGGKFTDKFDGLGAHVYTTLEVVPYFKTLDAIAKEISEHRGRQRVEGNLLASPGVRWAVGGFGRSFSSDSDLADGVRDAAGWFPVYGDRTQCLLVFAKPVTFSRITLHTPTIRDATLEARVGGKWRTLHEWKDQSLYELTYKGRAVTTDRIRIRPTKARVGYGSWLVHEITEMGVYK